MTPLVAFILGLLVGWLVEWIIDWWYWRRRNVDRQVEADANCRRRVTELEQEVASYRNQLASLQAERARFETPVRTKIIQPREVDRPTEPEVPAPVADVPAAQKVAPLEVDVSAEPDMEIPVVAKVQPLEVEVPAAVEQPPEMDLLEGIKGVTAAIAKRLNEAGIFTIAALAKLRPPQLRGIIADLLDRPGSEVEIIKQARLKAGTIRQVDDLVVIVGIGPVISRLLNEAGIFTFAELGALTAAELREIVGERIQRLANEDDILAQARELAEKQNQGG